MDLEIKVMTLFRWTVFISLSVNVNGNPLTGVDDNNMKVSETEPPFIHERAKYRVIMMRHGKGQANEKEVVSGWFDVNLTAEVVSLHETDNKPPKIQFYNVQTLNDITIVVLLFVISLVMRVKIKVGEGQTYDKKAWKLVQSRKGEKQARHVGANLKKLGYKFDVGHSSIITMTSRTLELVLEEMDLSSIEKLPSWRLNIRHSGSLGGMKLATMRKEYTKEQIDYWMHSYKTGPPPMTETHPQYKAITSDQRYIGNYGFVDFPTSESLEQALQRTIPYWETVIKPQIEENKRIIIVSHNSTLRTLAYYLEGSKDETLLRFKLTYAQPFIYEFDEHFNPLICRQLIPVGLPLPQSDVSTSSQGF